MCLQSRRSGMTPDADFAAAADETSFQGRPSSRICRRWTSGALLQYFVCVSPDASALPSILHLIIFPLLRANAACARTLVFSAIRLSNLYVFFHARPTLSDLTYFTEPKGNR